MIVLDEKSKSLSDNDKQLEEALLNNQFKYLKVIAEKNRYTVTLIDNQEYEILKGYGNTALEAINDLHSNLI